jgi:hypothetical protein
MIYGAMLIPFIASAVLLWKFKHRTAWWELVIPFVVSAVLITGFKYAAEASATKDREFWGGWAVSAHHFERWNEYIHRTCTRQVCSGSGKTRTCTTQTYDCSYVQNHPEHWELRDSNRQRHSITRATYADFVKLFGNQKFVDMRRNYHTIDGDQYQTGWPGSDETFTEVFTQHSYENRVQASRSVFNYRKISPEEAAAAKLIPYPEKVHLFHFPSVLGDCGQQTQAANERLQYHNAKLGAVKQVRMWLLCIDNPDPSAGADQESLWVGGNKNEVVLARGPGWVRVFTWADDKTFAIEARDAIVALEKWDPVVAVDTLAQNVRQGFKRKHFADFSYLTVETPTWAIWVTWIITLLVNGGISWWVVVNEIDEHGQRRYRWRHY